LKILLWNPEHKNIEEPVIVKMRERKITVHQGDDHIKAQAK
jgi:hypothetical protein